MSTDTVSKSITRADTAGAVRRLVAAFGHPAQVADGSVRPSELSAAYHAAVYMLDAAQLSGAVDRAIRVLRFFPRPRELRDLAPPRIMPDSVEDLTPDDRAENRRRIQALITSLAGGLRMGE